MMRFPKSISGKPVAQKWLDKTAREKWQEIIRTAPWLTRADSDLLGIYCVAWSRYLMAQKLANGAPVLKDKDNEPYENPA